jgi:hypothetical protein
MLVPVKINFPAWDVETQKPRPLIFLSHRMRGQMKRGTGRQRKGLSGVHTASSGQGRVVGLSRAASDGICNNYACVCMILACICILSCDHIELTSSIMIASQLLSPTARLVSIMSTESQDGRQPLLTLTRCGETEPPKRRSQGGGDFRIHDLLVLRSISSSLCLCDYQIRPPRLTLPKPLTVSLSYFIATFLPQR